MLLVGAVAIILSSAPGKVAEWELTGFAEPSGVVYHPGRDSLFMVGDQGDIAEVDLDGRILRSARLGGDLEGVTCDPVSGKLYVVREGHEVIFEVSQDDFAILRGFTIDRGFGKDPDFLRRGGDGIEGLTFVADEAHAEGGRFYAVNQYNPAVLLEIEVPLRSARGRFAKAHIVNARPVGTAPLSGLAWVAESGGFLIVSALWHRAYATDGDGRYLRSLRVPGIMPEGLAVLPDGTFVIAQDTGGAVLWKPGHNPFTGAQGEVSGRQEALRGFDKTPG